jgi:putative tryptophan/tyrosine transport system substrate-binding protein
MRRREFITLLGGAAAWPLAARAQQPEQVRRIGILTASTATDADAQAQVKAFRDGLQDLGWVVGRNIQIEDRWAAGDSDRVRAYAKELVALRLDVIVCNSVQLVSALRDETRTIPIVFASASDPVEAGLVESIARPGGNITGFTSIQAASNVKWLELIKEISPGTTRVAVILNSRDPSNLRRFRSIQDAGPLFKIDVTKADIGSDREIEDAIERFARLPDGGLIVLPSPITQTKRATIIRMAEKYRLPATYPFRYFAESGGLLAYGQDRFDQYRRTASYVDRILKGEKSADLPVQAPTRFELVINLKAAKAIGLIVPPMLLTRADAVIE